MGPTLTTPGIDTDAVPTMGPVPPAEWEGALSAHDAAQRRGRVLFVLDTSGSMAREARRARGRGSRPPPSPRRCGAWALATSSASGSSPTRRAPATSRPCRSARPTTLGARGAAAALNGARPAGNTPLFRTMIDGAAALPPDDPAQVDAVVVLTDGEDTSSGVGAERSARRSPAAASGSSSSRSARSAAPTRV